MVWPAALYEYYVEREPASSWYRMQIGQAVRFGAVFAVLAIAALAWPLVLSLLFANLIATLVFYGIALVLDCVLFVVWLSRALRYSKRAARGETFMLEPMLTRRTRSVAAKH